MNYLCCPLMVYGDRESGPVSEQQPGASGLLPAEGSEGPADEDDGADIMQEGNSFVAKVSCDNQV